MIEPQNKTNGSQSEYMPPADREPIHRTAGEQCVSSVKLTEDLVTSVSGRENKSTDGSGNQASEINRNLEVTRNRN